MTIQDIIVAAASGTLDLSLLPSVLSRQTRIPWHSSLVVGISLAVISVTLFTVGLYASALFIGLNSVEWFLLLAFRRAKGTDPPGPTQEKA